MTAGLLSNNLERLDKIVV